MQEVHLPGVLPEGPVLQRGHPQRGPRPHMLFKPLLKSPTDLNWYIHCMTDNAQAGPIHL